jgi:hypothetical protein
VLVPLGVLAVSALVPRDVLAECRVRARDWTERPRSPVAAAIIVAIWIALLVAAIRWFLRRAASS